MGRGGKGTSVNSKCQGGHIPKLMKNEAVHLNSPSMKVKVLSRHTGGVVV